MLQLCGRHLPDPDARYGPFPQPPLGAGHLSVEYPSRPSAVREARAEVRRQLERWGLGEDGEVAGAAALLVGEPATNALVHAGSRFRLTLFAAHGVLRCEIADASCGSSSAHADRWAAVGDSRDAPLGSAIPGGSPGRRGVVPVRGALEAGRADAAEPHIDTAPRRGPEAIPLRPSCRVRAFTVS
ncbi:hypothetical protein ABZ281_47050 [Streptomyces sp. NPDC006265]|uniref:ATP-binding protein n=1 Tax=Streptomyces sp. NPDC006265 TaxID=3156740 RepID=UPI0033ABF70F